MSSKRRETVRLNWIEAFVAVAEHESFTHAARTLGCEQSTVSRDVQALNKWLRGILFTGDKPELTAKGEAFLPVARQVVQMLNDQRSNPSDAQPRPKISGQDIKI